MPPTPPPVIINMPDTGAPWWGVPLLAGLFVIIGALVTFISTKASDKRKAKREDKVRVATESTESASTFMEQAARIEKAVAQQLTLSHVKFQGDYMNDIAALLEELDTAWTKFELVADKELLQPGKDLFAATIAMALPDLTEESTSHFRGEYHRKHLALVNALRVMNGVDPIEREIINPPTRTETMRMHGEYIRTAAEVMFEKARTNPPRANKSGQ
ncbi:hypothetical protein J2X12_004120 [Pseudarthrobacter oxydans]|uniref:Uncharacterized protein n=1 Tax=Pseudarthrobacter oxydans TaxID=1671 RepID=A0AAW8NEW6_PSEOX|nr:hypothetical protein [Pseudarthrobacter oxydans]MDR6794732.1 hypothetical protein [Pseudarthrobacter oxydans]MDR7166066.1 hypothetical protein [Pseudarthrobacter oxydans]